MRILLTGATGLVGRSLGKHAVTLGHEIVAVSRKPHDTQGLLPFPHRSVGWDALGGQPLPEQALHGVDAVIHLLGEPVFGSRWSVQRKQRIESSRVQSTQAIMQAIRALPAGARPRTVISASAVGYYGDRGDELLTEQAAAGTGFLADVCRKWEAELASGAVSDVRTVSVRIGVVLDQSGGILASLLPVFKSGLGGPVGSGKQWVSWIHVEDLVELFFKVLENETIRGPINGVAPHPVTQGDFARELGKALGRPAVVPTPAVALRLTLGEMGSIVLASQRVVPDLALREGFRFRYERFSEALAQIFGV